MKTPFSVLWLLNLLIILFSTRLSALPSPPLRFLTEHSPPGEYINEEGVVTGVTVELIRILQQRELQSEKVGLNGWGLCKAILFHCMA